MDVAEGLFDGKNLLLSKEEKVPLKDIKRARIEYHPYVVFPVSIENNSGDMMKTDTEIIYPHTVDQKLDNNVLVYGEKRPTRIMHYVPLGAKHLKRKPDLKHPHTVKILGYREIILEQNNGQEIRVNFDGNCIHVPEGVKTLDNGQEIVALEEFFDRPSELANIIKKAGIEVYSR